MVFNHVPIWCLGGNMIFAVDMGNSNIVLGCIEGDLLIEERIYTILGKTALEYAIDIKNFFEIYKKSPLDVEGAIISSVVPQLTDVIAEATQKVCKVKPMIVGPGLKTGVNIMIDNPKQLGADLIVAAAAALKDYEAPMVIIDMGTATTFSYIDEKKQFLGGAIMPGVVTSLNSLVNETSQLIKVALEAPKSIVGSNTTDCLKSGSIYGTVAMIDGMIARLREERKTDFTVIATGGLAELIIPYCKEKIIIDKSLLIKGLGIIYNKNKIIR